MSTRYSCPTDARLLLRGAGSLFLGLIPLAVLALLVLAQPKRGLAPVPRTDQWLEPIGTAYSAQARDECADGLALVPPPRPDLDPVRIHVARHQRAYVMSLKVRLRGAHSPQASRLLQDTLVGGQEEYLIDYLMVTPEGRRCALLPPPGQHAVASSGQ